MNSEEDDILNYLIDTTESLESKLKQTNLTMPQAKKDMLKFIAHTKNLCSTYSLPLDNKAKFCQDLFHYIDDIPLKEMILLFTAVICDNGLLFDIHRDDRTIRQDISCYLSMKQQMTSFTDKLTIQSAHNLFFRKLKEKKPSDIPTRTSHNKADIYFIFQTFTAYFPLNSQDKPSILIENISFLCSILANDKILLKIAPVFIYQVVRKHKSRLLKAELFHFEWENLWTYKSYQIATDNGKNFNNYIALINFFLDLCDYFSNDPTIDIELSYYIFSELSNLCEWYYTYFEYSENIKLPEPLSISIAQRKFDCCCDNSQYNCSNEELVEFFSYKKSYTKQIERKIQQYLQNHPSVIQQYINIFPADLDKKSHLIYQIFDNANLPLKFITPADLPIIHTAINLLLETEVNRQAEQNLLKTGRKLIDLLSDLEI